MTRLSPGLLVPRGRGTGDIDIGFDFGDGDLLLFVDREQHVIAEMMAAVHAAVAIIKENLRAFGEPQLLIVRREFYGHIFDGNVLRAQLDLRYGGDQIRFEADDLEIVRRNPGAAA